MYEFWIYFFGGIISCFFLDLLSRLIFCKFATKGSTYSQNVRWFFIHFIINCFVSYFGMADLIFCLTNMQQCAISTWINGDLAYGIAVSLHIYHILAFKLTPIDWLHHTMTALISTPIMLLFCTQSSAVMALWFMSGFPGAIDYFLLWLVKMGYISSELEKKIYVALSVWLRAPGCIMTCALELSLLSMIDQLPWINIVALLWTTFIVYWNGLFFMHITLASYYTKEGKVKQERYNKIKDATM